MRRKQATDCLRNRTWPKPCLPHRLGGVEDMVSAMCDSEDSQLLAFAAFLKSSKLAAALQINDWTTFARGYNGPNFAQNHYDSNLRGEFQKFSAGALPDIATRAAQLY